MHAVMTLDRFVVEVKMKAEFQDGIGMTHDYWVLSNNIATTNVSYVNRLMGMIAGVFPLQDGL